MLLHLLLYLIVVGGGIVVLIKFLRIIHTSNPLKLSLQPYTSVQSTPGGWLTLVQVAHDHCGKRKWLQPADQPYRSVLVDARRVANSRLDISNLLLPLHLVSELNLGRPLIILWGEKDYDKKKMHLLIKLLHIAEKKIGLRNHICNLVRLPWVHLMSDSSWRCGVIALFLDHWENEKMIPARQN